MSSCPPIVLTFAASDPTGGAGLQADLLTLAAMGCHPLSVLTALTVQDTSGVDSVQAVDAERVRAQAEALLADMRVAAFKLGVLGSAENMRVIADLLSDLPEIPVVLDPVLASGRGDPLASEEMAQALCELIVPQATIVTPNSVEARRLGGAERLLAMGCEFVLVTGTHEASDEVVNTLYDGGGVVRADRWQRLPGSYHGSGCTLASAIAAALASGRGVPEAVRDAQEYTWQTLAAAFAPGRGQFLPNRFFWHDRA
ncbi:MAG: hydroxymethylpyrimidine/phosphomethylpyrimidine kinase [Betaproteobacteria bacterium RIFCSPLOWO2_12_FULL_65_14]|nr:MAG: hydroxymethylpyrimidine/phosphomethylpyrimidine kinase [Betaproteobacteria bacterium RIFCSPLOWO2_12_FULL_65_14]